MGERSGVEERGGIFAWDFAGDRLPLHSPQPPPSQGLADRRIRAGPRQPPRIPLLAHGGQRQGEGGPCSGHFSGVALLALRQYTRTCSSTSCSGVVLQASTGVVLHASMGAVLCASVGVVLQGVGLLHGAWLQGTSVQEQSALLPQQLIPPLRYRRALWRRRCAA